jgi:RNA:NAD 2'-phosphotransferase (TPT1/KptA family)
MPALYYTDPEYYDAESKNGEDRAVSPNNNAANTITTQDDGETARLVKIAKKMAYWLRHDVDIPRDMRGAVEKDTLLAHMNSDGIQASVGDLVKITETVGNGQFICDPDQEFLATKGHSIVGLNPHWCKVYDVNSLPEQASAYIGIPKGVETAIRKRGSMRPGTDNEFVSFKIGTSFLREGKDVYLGLNVQSMLEDGVFELYYFGRTLFVVGDVPVPYLSRVSDPWAPDDEQVWTRLAPWEEREPKKPFHGRKTTTQRRQTQKHQTQSRRPPTQ